MKVRVAVYRLIGVLALLFAPAIVVYASSNRFMLADAILLSVPSLTSGVLILCVADLIEIIGGTR